MCMKKKEKKKSNNHNNIIIKRRTKNKEPTNYNKSHLSQQIESHAENQVNE